MPVPVQTKLPAVELVEKLSAAGEQTVSFAMLITGISGSGLKVAVRVAEVSLQPKAFTTATLYMPEVFTVRFCRVSAVAPGIQM